MIGMLMLLFEYWYMVYVFVIYFFGDIDLVFVVLIEWVCVNQLDFVMNFVVCVSGIIFEVGICDQVVVDLLIWLVLMESVVVMIGFDGWLVIMYVDDIWVDLVDMLIWVVLLQIC